MSVADAASMNKEMCGKAKVVGKDLCLGKQNEADSTAEFLQQSFRRENSLPPQSVKVKHHPTSRREM